MGIDREDPCANDVLTDPPSKVRTQYKSAITGQLRDVGHACSFSIIMDE
jgi:hypothetical protein